MNLPFKLENARSSSGSALEALVLEYAAAKSRQDVDAALQLCSDDFSLYSPSLHASSTGRENTRHQLRYFFKVFPDFSTTLQGTACNDYGVACWGNFTMTMRASFLGFKPTGRTLSLPFFSLFTASGDRLSAEYFHFDLAGMCAQLALPYSRLRRTAKLVSYVPESALRYLL